MIVASSRLVAAGDSAFGAGFIAFLIVLALCVGSFFLFRSMSRHLRKVPDSFEPPPDDDGSE
ncbi:MAG TPA: hypothetical protein VHE57_12460 [Mycobacteriales bacterium]|jgi:hypothetical protein|nr:hypothetical protein [Mycobacteriales bacterium]